MCVKSFFISQIYLIALLLFIIQIGDNMCLFLCTVYTAQIIMHCHKILGCMEQFFLSYTHTHTHTHTEFMYTLGAHRCTPWCTVIPPGEMLTTL